MARSVPYLTFPGNCREAMQFYSDCLNGELHLQSLEDAPDAADFPENLKQLVLHAELRVGERLLMASDLNNESGIIHGNAMAIFLECRNLEELYRCFEKLITDGSVIHPPENSQYQTISCSLIDRYHIRWILYFAPTPEN